MRCLVLVEASVGGRGGQREVGEDSTILHAPVLTATTVQPAEEGGVSPGVQVCGEGVAPCLESKGVGLVGGEGHLCYHCSIGTQGTGMQGSGLVHTGLECC